MPTYILLVKLTDQGIKNIKDAPRRSEQAAKQLEAMGGRLISIYTVMGEYDYVAIGEAPNDETIMTFLLGLGSLGNVRTTTLRAFTREEFSQIIEKLP